MIIIMVVIMLSGLLGFKNINERIEKNALSVELMNNLSAAKLSRVTYEYTEDDKYVNQNKLAMNNLSKILDKLYTYQWSESGVALLDKAQRDLKNYFTGRAAFDVVLQKKREIKKRLNNRDFYQKSTELNAWSLDTTLPVEQRMMLAQLSFVASDLDSLMVLRMRNNSSIFLPAINESISKELFRTYIIMLRTLNPIISLERRSKRHRLLCLQMQQNWGK
ncbi:hypothetical protein [Citrobacter sp. Res13-Sevr-PEB04-36]|uniref:hypothetical protein n=1 Tax=Citrobacter sp. Res13-Sevr-PEB04-36 TaxID=2777960 RepID=UPI0018ACD52E|nr:hypothetical protein [Citrobacter sp. Res13-Sevr-PEB04-36]